MEHRQATPSVMARLMGLDELPPPQQPVQKKPRVLSENYLQKVASIGVREKCTEHHSFRLSLEQQKECKDVVPVLETLKRDKLHNMSVEAKLNHTSRKLMQAKRVSMDKELLCFKKCHDVSKVIHSKPINSLKWLQEPDILFTKKVNDIQDAPYHQKRYITVLKSLCASDCRDIGMCRKSWMLGEKEHVNSPQKVENGLGTYSCGELGLDDKNNFSGSSLESNRGSCLRSTRIVLLKPNLGKPENAARSPSTVSHEVFHSDDKNHREILSTQNGAVKERKNLAYGMGLARPQSRFSKEITRKMGHGISSTSAKAIRSEIRGSTSETFAEQSELMMLSFPILSYRKNQYYSSDGLYVAGEAKKQICERWKTTKWFQQVELDSKSRTLGEMLAIPDDESRPMNLDCKAHECGVSNQLSPGSEDGNFCTPSSISSWDAWKDGHIRDLPRSRSLLVNFNSVGSPNTRTIHKSLQSCRYMEALESVNLVQPMSGKQDSNMKDGSEHRKSDFRYNKSPSIRGLESGNNDFVEANHDNQNDVENKLEEQDSHGKSSELCKSCGQNDQTFQDTWVIQKGHKNEDRDGYLCDQNSAARLSSMSRLSSISMVADTIADAETEVVEVVPSYHDSPQLEPKNCILSIKDEDSSSYVLDTSDQCEQDISNVMTNEEFVSSCCSATDPDADPESLMSLEKAYQPSPDSVLEPLYKMEISFSSDCFKSVNSSLHDLHMEVELLKSETSSANSEGSGLVSSDEDIEEGSESNNEEKNEDIMRLLRVEDGRDFSYLVDVLTEAGFHNRNLQMGFDAWHNQECPINSSVFETLEKKYGEQISWKRSERRLLFDRINLGMMEILQPSMGVPAWTRPVARRFSFRLGKELIEEGLWMLLVSHKNEASEDFEKVLGNDDRWLDLRDDIKIIGREIENSLINELVADVVSMDSF